MPPAAGSSLLIVYCCKVRRGRLMAYVSKPIVLVVEDDAMQRLLAVTVVEDAGFEAIEADNADEAIDILESQNEIRIVFYGHRDAREHGRDEAGRRRS